MYKTSAKVANFVTYCLKFWQKLVDAKRAESASALDGADMQVQNVSLLLGG